MKEYLLSSADRSQSFESGLSTVDLTGEEADTFFDALASATTRAILDALYEEPATASELADRSETSLQNVHYHLEKLEAAELIEPVDVVYSSRGREVDVYGPTNRAIVLVAGEQSLVGELKTALARFVGVLAVLAVGALLVQSMLAGGLVGTGGAPAGDPTAGGAEATPTTDGEVRAGDAGGGELDTVSSQANTSDFAARNASTVTNATATPTRSPLSRRSPTPSPANVTATPTPTSA